MTPPTGYNKANEEEGITINSNGQVVEKTIKNQIKKGSIEVTKKDKDSQKVLKGVVFELKKGDTKTTDENGKAVFTNVSYGAYNVVEKTALESYVADSTPHEVSIENEGQKVELSIANELKKGTITMRKVGKYNPKLPIEGVRFSLQKAKTDASGNTTYEEIATAVSDKDDMVTFNKVVYRDYRLVEKLH